jgi:DNA repair protein RecN (Recombination protein N)
MLERLRISNFALVGSLELDFERGLVILTGETGAGKSLLIGALSSLLGSKIDSDLILTGEEEALVEGVFSDVGDDIKDLLKDMGVGSGRSLTIRRKMEKKGRSSSLVNDSPVPLSHLKEIGRRLLEINGQNQHARLLDEANHAKILDSVQEIAPFAEQVSRLADNVKKLNGRYKLVAGKAGDVAKRMDFLRQEIEEILKVNPKDGEDEELRAKKNVLQNMSKVMENLNGIEAVLSQDEPSSAMFLLKDLTKRAEELAGFEKKWLVLLKEIEGAKNTLLEIRNEAETEASELIFDPAELERIDERLYHIERLKRKFGPLVQDVLEHLSKSQSELDELGSMPVDKEVIRKELDEAFRKFREQAEILSEKRIHEAPPLSAKIESALRPLALEKARFKIDFYPRSIADPDDVTEKGFEDAYFLFSANEGEPLKPLSKIASGGEISRTILAILCSAGGEAGPKTVVFDEVDAGIGGRPADKVGNYLSGLAKARQVICVTHLPQIAAFADQHIKVEKMFENGRTLVKAACLRSAPERNEELARMLAGEKITDSAKAHAKELIKIANLKKKN